MHFFFIQCTVPWTLGIHKHATRINRMTRNIKDLRNLVVIEEDFFVFTRDDYSIMMGFNQAMKHL